MKNNQIDLSIIIVNYNTKDLTASCIDSIIKHTKNLDYEIILVDNGSMDGSTEYFENLCRNALRPPAELEGRVPTIIKNGKNLGYAQANNIGIKASKGNAILLLNSDTLITDNSIFDAYQKLSDADILTVNIKNPDGSHQQAGGFGPTLLNLFFWAFFLDDLPLISKLVKPYQISRLSFFDKDHDLDWVMGAFFMACRAVFEKTGLLDEEIFMYGEEMEYCRRARGKGFKIKYFSAPSIIHFGMGSAESAEGAILGEYRALKYFFRKFEPTWKNLLLYAIIKASILLRLVIFKLINQEKAKIYEKAIRTT